MNLEKHFFPACFVALFAVMNGFTATEAYEYKAFSLSGDGIAEIAVTGTIDDDFLKGENRYMKDALLMRKIDNGGDSFYISVYELTFQQAVLLGIPNGHDSGLNGFTKFAPVIPGVSKQQVLLEGFYAGALTVINGKANASGLSFAYPTTNQWFSAAENLTVKTGHSSGGTASNVGTSVEKSLCDMLGNVAEFCQEGVLLGGDYNTAVKDCRTPKNLTDTAIQGIRLVYVAPATSAEVTVDGVSLGQKNFGETVTVTVPKTVEGKEWKGWMTSPAELDWIVANETFSMPSESVTLTSNWGDLTRVWIADAGSQTQEWFPVNTVLTLTNNAAPVGYKITEKLPETYTVGSTDANLKAVYTEVTGVTPDATYSIIGGEYEIINGIPKNLKPEQAPFGYEFDSWKTVNCTISGDVVIITPSELNAVVIATYKKSRDYAIFDLSDGSLSYADSLENSYAVKTSKMPLKRLSETDSDTFLGLYETTVGQFTAITNATQNASIINKMTNSVAELPFPLEKFENASKILSALSELCGQKFELPSFAQMKIAGGSISLTTQNQINCGTNSFLNVGSKAVSTNGFYDIWGNASEITKETTANNKYAYGGNYSMSLNNILNTVNGNKNSDTIYLQSNKNSSTTLRPLLTVNVVFHTLTLFGEQYQVRDGEILALEDLATTERKTFAGWQKTNGEKVIMPLTVNADIELIPSWTDYPVTRVTVVDENSDGKTVFGSTILKQGEVSTIFAASTNSLGHIFKKWEITGTSVTGNASKRICPVNAVLSGETKFKAIYVPRSSGFNLYFE